MKAKNNVTVQDQDGNSTKPLLADVLSTNADLFGKNLEYNKGDIVVWKGRNAAILRIGYDFKADFRAHVLECAKSTLKKYNSLHYSNLRLATDEEIKYLGDLDILVL